MEHKNLFAAYKVANDNTREVLRELYPEVDFEGELKAEQKANRPVMERIKTFDDAVDALGEKNPLVEQYRLIEAAFGCDELVHDLMATTKEHIIQYCEEHDFELRKEDFDGSIYQYSKYLSETTLLFIGVSDFRLNVGFMVLDTQQQVYKSDTTTPISFIEPSDWRLYLSTMVQGVVMDVFYEMTGLGFNTKNWIK